MLSIGEVVVEDGYFYHIKNNPSVWEYFLKVHNEKCACLCSFLKHGSINPSCEQITPM